MKTVSSLATALLVSAALIQPAPAKDITITMTDQDQQSMAVLGLVYDQCIGGLTIRNETAACKNLYGFLTLLGEKVKAAQAAQPAPAPEGEQSPK